MSNRNGGPAFPRASNRPYGDHGYDGMTLRDYFAAKALQGMCAADGEFSQVAARLAEWAYEYADAMLAERAKNTP
jgi:small ligand-binding sensory domain FIST